MNVKCKGVMLSSNECKMSSCRVALREVIVIELFQQPLKSNQQAHANLHFRRF